MSPTGHRRTPREGNLTVAVTGPTGTFGAGLVPLLGTFVAVLAVLSVHDLIDGEVTTARELTHLATVCGLVLLVLLDRTERALPPRLARPVDESPADPKLRGVA